MAKKNKGTLLKIESFFEENQLILLESQKAYNFLLSIIGSDWKGKILIKEIKKPLWVLLIGSKIFSRNLTMLLNSKSNIQKFELEFNYKPIFKIEVDGSLLANLREKPAKITIPLPNKPKKGEGKKIILQKYLNFEVEDSSDKIIKKNKNYKNYKKCIYEYINEGNLINLPIEETKTKNKQTISLENDSLFLELKKIIKTPDKKVYLNKPLSKVTTKNKKRKNLKEFFKVLDLEE